MCKGQGNNAGTDRSSLCAGHQRSLLLGLTMVSWGVSDLHFIHEGTAVPVTFFS